MNIKEFNKIKKRFIEANLEEKIDIYATTEDFTENQYKELLRVFPREHLSKLEEALV